MCSFCFSGPQPPGTSSPCCRGWVKRTQFHWLSWSRMSKTRRTSHPISRQNPRVMWMAMWPQRNSWGAGPMCRLWESPSLVRDSLSLSGYPRLRWTGGLRRVALRFYFCVFIWKGRQPRRAYNLSSEVPDWDFWLRTGHLESRGDQGKAWHGKWDSPAWSGEPRAWIQRFSFRPFDLEKGQPGNRGDQTDSRSSSRKGRLLNSLSQVPVWDFEMSGELGWPRSPSV